MAIRPGTRKGVRGMARGVAVSNESASCESASDEIALIDGVVAERMDAFESLYRLYHPRWSRFLLGMLRRPALVEEVLDDTMMVVWRKAHTYNASAKVSTWIFGIAYRQALKAIRQFDGDDAASMPEEAFFVEASQPGPDGAAQQRELHEQLHHAMSELSADHRAVIELTYYLGYSCRDIARIMDCPVDTVKTRMFYARRRLRTLLTLSREEAI